VVVFLSEAPLIYPPQQLNEDSAALTLGAAEALFAVPGSTHEAASRLAIVGPEGVVVHATSAALALFGARTRADLQIRLMGGEGPSARRLRHLAATLPVGGPLRLERMRFSSGPRPVEVNLQCARAATPEGATFLVLSMAVSAFRAEASASIGSTGAALTPAVAVQRQVPPKSRFLWALDEFGRFGGEDPHLTAALGVNAPRPGETLEELLRRAQITDGAKLARVLERRETFSGVAIFWPTAVRDCKIEIMFSGAPAYGLRREFAGYRGFGVLCEPVSLPTPGAARLNQKSVELPSASSEPVDGAGHANPEPMTANVAGIASSESAEAEDARTPDAQLPDEQQQTESAQNSGRGPPERSAEIYVLRQTATPSSAAKVVRIRPGALDAPASRSPAPGAGGESVELSKSERDAFREIARALVGRISVPPDDHPTDAEPLFEADDETEEVFQAHLRKNGAIRPEIDDDPVGRNAAGVLDRLPFGVLVARDARALYLNNTLLALLGYNDFEHFETADGLAAMFRGRDPHSISAERGGALSIVRTDGKVVAVDGHAQAIIWDGAPATLIVLRRSTETGLEDKPRDAERERDSRARNDANELQEMLDHATDGTVALDSAGRILSLNGPAQRLFDYPQTDVVGESVLRLLAPQSHLEATARLEDLSRPGSGSLFAAIGRRRDGTALPLALTLARIGPREASHFCALVRDVSRERETERRLAAARDAALTASSAKTDFLAQVSHEIRTPLHAILGFSEVMMEERFGPIGNDRYKDYLKDIYASGKHVMSLADDLLDLSKIESGKLELAFAPVDANSVIRECVSLMQPQAARERIIMRISLFDHLPHVIVDERSLRQIMLNLMSNAVKFNEPGGQVIVSTAVDTAGQAVIRVRDTGVGMNENEIGLALEPFGQIGKPGRKRGAGLGLPLTKALVEANRAEFSIKSRREQGTLIEIAFPTIQAAQ
jgi:PAS domain S-box-containing protein